MKSLAIVALCIGSAVVYGIVHDQITARICVEYFTIGHPPVFDTKSPTLLAIGWGIIATWWVGLLLGVPLAIVARAGRRPKRDARSLVRPIITLLVVMAVCALISGTIGYVLAQRGSVYLVEPLSERVPLEKQAAFLADLWAHSMSYLVGFVGGLVVIGSVWRSRGRTATNPQIPK
ncbi:MAG: hypothetical protein ABI353_07940 [Isosphaeraceae bacterium]